ncbi:MAG TPA: hypothetical protein VG405_12090, partial [Solirubrobacteraceae bacterium]|nr:hypothetical protein [Solirubrobacteraceae bacterium]
MRARRATVRPAVLEAQPSAEPVAHPTRRRWLRRHARATPGRLRRFWRLAWDSNITGLSAMVAYNMLLGIIPVALLGLFVAGHI